MAFDLARIQHELGGAPLASPIPPELAAAIVSDLFRFAALAPPAVTAWEEWLTRPKQWPLLADQLGMLAHALATTSLRLETIGAIAAAREAFGTAAAVGAALSGFFTRVAPLTGEMVRANAFRQEEFLRQWIATWRGQVAGESPEQAAARLSQLDYGKTLVEYEAAERARRDEARKREEAIKKAAEEAAAARGWRE